MKPLFALLVLLLALPALAQQTITNVNVGATAGDGTGDGLRTAFIKLNNNDDLLDSTKASLDQLTSLSNRIHELTINVQDYGAVPHYPTNFNGTESVPITIHDSTTNIQAALDAAYESAGVYNTVLVPKGIFRISTNLNVPPGISIRGVGYLHAGDVGLGVNMLDTNSYSVIWQSNPEAGGLRFAGLKTKGSYISHIEISGYTNPIAWMEQEIKFAASENLADGPGLFIGSSLVDPITGEGADGYSGGMLIDNLSIVGFKLGVRSTANSGIYNRLLIGGCDVGYETSEACCGGDQLIFSNCSVNNRAKGIGYVFHSGSGNRGAVFLSPSDYQIAKWIVATNGTYSLIGGNMELIGDSVTNKYFAELWGADVVLNISGSRIQGGWNSLIYYGESLYAGPRGQLNGVMLDMPNYTNTTFGAGLAPTPMIIDAGVNYGGGFSANGGTMGVVRVRNGASTAMVYPLSGSTRFAPAARQPTIYGAVAWGGTPTIQDYGVPWILKGYNGPDSMEVWLAHSSTEGQGPLGHRKVILGDNSFATDSAAPNSLTLDSLVVNSNQATAGTNTAVEFVATGGITLGGVRNTAWPSGGSGSGETNTASNVGGGTNIFRQKTGVDLEFKTLLPGTGVTFDVTDTNITINSSGGGSQTPWTADIDGGGFSLTNAPNFSTEDAGGQTFTAPQFNWWIPGAPVGTEVVMLRTNGFQFGTDNVFDIGLSSNSGRPRDIHAARDITVNGVSVSANLAATNSATSIRFQGTNYTALVTDFLIVVAPTNSYNTPRRVDLPPAATVGQKRVVIKKINPTGIGFGCFANPDGTETIDYRTGQKSLPDSANSALVLQVNPEGTGWIAY